MLISLICEQCSGKLEIEQSQVVESDDSVILLNDQTFTCPYCGVKYLPGEEVRRYPTITVGSMANISGSINISGGDLIVNNNSKPITSPRIHAPQQFQSGKPQREGKPPKKWWEFWKS
jgi:hypothetical protein